MARYYCRHVMLTTCVCIVWICEHVFIRVAIDLFMLSNQQLGGATR